MSADISTELHPAIRTFPVRDGRLVVGGIPLDLLAERVGSTPFFAYDRSRIDGRVAELRVALGPDIRVSYAIKANPMPAVVQHLATRVDGFDVASAGELKTALDTPMNAEHVSFAGPGKGEDELRRAIAAGVLVEIESESEMRRIAAVCDSIGMRSRVAVRINPDFHVKASAMKMGGGSTQFGVDAERVPQLLRDIAATGLEFVGFHVFGGSQNLRADLLAETYDATVDLVLRMAADAPGPVRHLNLGGGLGIPYFPKDVPLDLAPVGDRLRDLAGTRIARELPEARVAVELGRYLVGEAGIYVVRVVDRKESRGKTFLVTDGGLHHHLAASGNFGQVLRRNFPVAIGNRMNADTREIASVVGCLCTPLDLLADEASLAKADVGDLVVVFQSGAYAATASPTAFLGHPAPVEVLV